MIPFSVTPVLRAYAQRGRTALARQDPVAAQEQELRKLVMRASNTRFGRDHGFATLRNVADYQRAVPLRRYEDFWRDYWQAVFPVLVDVTWPGKIPFFAATSGTTAGTSKNIPVTHAMNQANIRGALDLLLHHLVHRPQSRAIDGKNFFLGGSVALKERAPGVFSGDLSGIALHETPFWYRGFTFPPSPIAREADWEKKIEDIAHLAPEADIRILGGTPPWLLHLIGKQQALAGEPVIADTLYPNLELLVHGGVGFAPYRARFERFLNGRAEMREIYPASEGLIASQDEGPEDGLRLMLDNGLFFEFIPVDELDNPSPTRHTVADAELGVNYALALSTCAGCWSYIIGDTVRFVSLRPPRIRITGRISYFLSAFGEHLTGEEIEAAVTAGAASIDVSLSDFAVGAKFPSAPGELGKHIYIVECDRYPLGDTDADAFRAALDRALCCSNDDYRTERKDYAVIGAPQLLFVPPGTFAEWMKLRGRFGGQNKVPRVVKDTGLFSHLEEFARARTSL